MQGMSSRAEQGSLAVLLNIPHNPYAETGSENVLWMQCIGPFLRKSSKGLRMITLSSQSAFQTWKSYVLQVCNLCGGFTAKGSWPGLANELQHYGDKAD